MLSLLDGLFGQNMRSFKVEDSVSVPSSKEDAVYIPFVKLLVWKFDKSQKSVPPWSLIMVFYLLR